jgi:hypothetical protein
MGRPGFGIGLQRFTKRISSGGWPLGDFISEDETGYYITEDESGYYVSENSEGEVQEPFTLETTIDFETPINFE